MYATEAAAVAWAQTWAERTLSSNIADKTMEDGLAKRSDLESIVDSWRVWGRDPDAMSCFSHSEIVTRLGNIYTGVLDGRDRHGVVCNRTFQWRGALSLGQSSSPEPDTSFRPSADHIVPFPP